MNGLTIVGALLIVLAVIGLAIGGVAYKDKDTTEIGPIDVTTTDTEHVRIPKALSIAGLVVGGLLVFAGTRRRSA
jgi:hypothetical protein